MHGTALSTTSIKYVQENALFRRYLHTEECPQCAQHFRLDVYQCIKVDKKQCINKININVCDHYYASQPNRFRFPSIGDLHARTRGHVLVLCIVTYVSNGYDHRTIIFCAVNS